jgi:hypothetical protein
MKEETLSYAIVKKGRKEMALSFYPSSPPPSSSRDVKQMIHIILLAAVSSTNNLPFLFFQEVRRVEE